MLQNPKQTTNTGKAPKDNANKLPSNPVYEERGQLRQFFQKSLTSDSLAKVTVPPCSQVEDLAKLILEEKLK